MGLSSLGTPRSENIKGVEALEQPLLLPKDMEAYRRYTQNDLLLSLKRDLAMVSSLHTQEFRC